MKRIVILALILALVLPCAAGQKESEPNNTPNEADPLPLKGVLEARVSGLKDTDYFYYIGTAPQRDLVKITIEGATRKFFPLLDVLDAERHAVGSANSLDGDDIEMTVSLRKEEMLHMAVSSTNSSGERLRGTAANYTIGIEHLHAYDAHEPNETFASYQPMDQPTIKANLMDDIDVDYYRFKYAGDVRDRMEIVLKPRDDFRPELTLYDHNRKQIEQVSDFDLGVKLRIEFTAEENGIYYLRVDSLNSMGDKEDAKGGDYRLSYKPLRSYDAREPDNDFFSSGVIAPGETISGNIMDEVDRDFSRLELPKDHFYIYAHIENESDTLRPALDVYDSRKVLIKSFVNERIGEDLKGYLTLTPERAYYFSVDAVNSQGNRQRASHGAYSLTVYANTVDDFTQWE